MAARKPKVTYRPGFTASLEAKAVKQLEKKMGDGTVEHLLISKMSAEVQGKVEALAAEAMMKLARTADTLLAGFTPAADNTNPSLSIETVGGKESPTVASIGMAWRPLAAGTLRNKGLKRYRKKLKDGRVKMYGVRRGVQKRVWAHRGNDTGKRIVQQLSPALLQMMTMKPKLVRTHSRGLVVKRGKTSSLKIEYALTFPGMTGGAGKVLQFIMLRPFVRGRWTWLKKAGYGEETYTGQTVAEMIVYPEANRPLLGPAAARSGHVFRTQLRRLLK